MAFGKLGQLGRGFGGRLGGALNPAAFAPYPAPSGLRWIFITSADGERVTSNGEPTVTLVGS